MTTWPLPATDAGTFVGTVEPIVSLADVKSWLNYPDPSGASSDDALLTNITTAACEYIEREVGPIAPTQYTERYDGWGGNTIMLRHSPVVSVTYVNEYRSTGGLHVLPESTPENTVDGYQLQAEYGRIVRVFEGNWPRTFYPGSQNIEIQYTAGHTPTPAVLQMAACELAAHWWQQGHQARAKGFGTPQNSQHEAVEMAGAWIGVPNKVVDKLRQFRVPQLG